MHTAVRAALVLTSLAPVLTAQTDPVGTWLVRSYGEELVAQGSELPVQVCLTGETIDVTVEGGTPSGEIVVMVSDVRGQVPLAPFYPGQTLLVPTYATPLMIPLDGNGGLNISAPASALGNGLTNYFFQVGEFGNGDLRLSKGYEVSLRQTGELTYGGPSLDTYIGITEGTPEEYQLTAQFLVPTQGYSVQVDSITARAGLYVVKLTLNAPSGPAAPTVLPLSAGISLGQQLGHAIEVHVRQGAGQHDLAAVLSTTCLPPLAVHPGGGPQNQWITLESQPSQQQPALPVLQ